MLLQEIGQMVATLCVLTPAFLLLEMLLPNGSLRKYARFVFALVEILAILSPVMTVVREIGKVVS